MIKIELVVKENKDKETCNVTLKQPNDEKAKATEKQTAIVLYNKIAETLKNMNN